MLQNSKNSKFLHFLFQADCEVKYSCEYLVKNANKQVEVNALLCVLHQ